MAEHDTTRGNPELNDVVQQSDIIEQPSSAKSASDDGDGDTQIRRHGDNQQRTAPSNHEVEKLLADYRETVAAWRWYADTRFKLLGLVPVGTAIAVGLLSTELGFPSMLIAGVGFVTTVGLMLYDIRNTMMHDAAIHRAKKLETILSLPYTNGLGHAPGLLGERPRGRATVLGLSAYHDGALRIVYSITLAAWAGLLVRSILAVLNDVLEPPWPALEVDRTVADSWQWLAALAAAVLVFALAHRSMRKEEEAMRRSYSNMRLVNHGDTLTRVREEIDESGLDIADVAYAVGISETLLQRMAYDEPHAEYPRWLVHKLEEIKAIESKSAREHLNKAGDVRNAIFRVEVPQKLIDLVLNSDDRQITERLSEDLKKCPRAK